MIKYTLCPSQVKLDLFFQQHPLQGRVHARDYAFYMRKLAFMQTHKQSASEKKEHNRNPNNG